MTALALCLFAWLCLGLHLIQYATSIRTAEATAIETDVGTSPIMRIYNGTPPANVAAALSGNTLLAQGTLPVDWATEASGVLTMAGTWTLTGQSGAGTGTAGTFFRIYASDGTTAKIQGTVSAQVQIATNALTAANGNVLNFASTTGVSVGMNVSGTGVPTGSTVVAVTSTTVTISQTSTAGVANATTVTFGGDLVLDNNSIANAQNVNVSTFSITTGNA